MRLKGFSVTLFFLGTTLPAFVSAANFSDIYEQHPYAEAIQYVKEQHIAGGYGDGSFRSDRTINRAEALKLISSAALENDSIERCIRERGLVYKDVSRSDWFAPYICAAESAGIIDAKTQQNFRPADKITVAEIVTMLARAFDVEKDGEASPWFAPYVKGVAKRNAIPSEIRSAGERVTRGQIAEMIWRLKEGVRDRTVANIDDLIERKCTWFEQQDIPAVDEEEVMRQWFSWVNGERELQQLVPYLYDKQLSHTAAMWSALARDKGSITHKRSEQAAYYDYKMITSWFADEGLTFDNNHGSTFTENIGWGVYRCSAQDCTQKMIDALRTTFDMYMNEKTKESRPHYNSLVNAEFTRMGLGLALDTASGKYYATIHYATNITSDPQPLCP